jgi:hypothetical protein
MTLPTFIATYDQSAAVVLLQGNRDVCPGDGPTMQARSTQHMRFRSGNAGGADAFFAAGVVAVDPTRLEVVTSYSGHHRAYNRCMEGARDRNALKAPYFLRDTNYPRDMPRAQQPLCDGMTMLHGKRSSSSTFNLKNVHHS